MNQLRKFTKTLLAIGLVLVIYGFLSRMGGLYFFWESQSVGWAIILLGLIGLLNDRIKLNKEKKKKSILEKIGIGVLVFILLVQTIFVVSIPFSDAFSVAKEYLKNSEPLTQEIGSVVGFGLIPTGGIQTTTDSQGTHGSASIRLIVKGEKKFKDVTVYVVKYADQAKWTVEHMD